GADLREAQMGPLLLGADRVLPTNLTHAQLKGCDLTGADVRHALFVEADLSRSNFTRSLLKQADFTGIVRHGARGLDEVI
ncbi:MAG TPA: pentapeptide repeat-containing protein, partial [Phenylobacterium sp.]|nr:pentapeptide repeat-containing protein [Phenylobacterium sp.]